MEDHGAIHRVLVGSLKAVRMVDCTVVAYFRTGQIDILN